MPQLLLTRNTAKDLSFELQSNVLEERAEFVGIQNRVIPYQVDLNGITRGEIINFMKPVGYYSNPSRITEKILKLYLLRKFLGDFKQISGFNLEQVLDNEGGMIIKEGYDFYPMENGQIFFYNGLKRRKTLDGLYKIEADKVIHYLVVRTMKMRPPSFNMEMRMGAAEVLLGKNEGILSYMPVYCKDVYQSHLLWGIKGKIDVDSQSKIGKDSPSYMTQFLKIHSNNLVLVFSCTEPELEKKFDELLLK